MSLNANKITSQRLLNGRSSMPCWEVYKELKKGGHELKDYSKKLHRVNQIAQISALTFAGSLVIAGVIATIALYHVNFKPFALSNHELHALLVGMAPSAGLAITSFVVLSVSLIIRKCHLDQHLDEQKIDNLISKLERRYLFESRKNIWDHKTNKQIRNKSSTLSSPLINRKNGSNINKS